MDKAGRRWLFLGLLFVVALATRLIYLKLYNSSYLISPDGLLYSNMADNLIKGHGLVNTIRDRDYVVGPIYPLLLASVFWVFGTNNFAMVVILQGILQALSAVICYQIGVELFGRRYALIPYLLFLGYPLFAYWGIYVLTETSYVFLMTLFLYLLVLCSRRYEKNNLKYPLLLGVVMGIANLTRPLLLLVFPVLFLWFLYLGRWQFRPVIRNFLILCAVTGVVMSPWWVRNYLKYNQFIAATNYGAFELYAGNNPYTVTGEYYASTLKTYDPAVKEKVEKLPVLEQEKKYSQLAKDYILKHPVKFVLRTADKAVNLFWKPVASWEGSLYRMPAYFLDKWYLLLGLAGALISLFNFRKYGFLTVLGLYYCGVVSMITVVSGGRYRLPIMPVVVVLASLSLVTLFKGLTVIVQKNSR